MTRKTLSNTFTVNTVEDGKRGKVGRFFYYAGDFDENNNTKVFLVNDAQSPFFSHIGSGGITRFHVFNPETNPPLNTMTMAAMWAASNRNWNNAPWEAMADDFKYIITEAIFSNFAHLGGAIISGDWMISQYGTINGQTSQNFQAFDSEHPNDDVGTNFIPNFCVNFKTGATYQNSAVVRGTVYAESGYFNGSLRTTFHDISNESGWVYYSQSDTRPSGMGVGWNYVVGDYDNMCMLAKKESPSSGVMSNNLHVRLPNTLSMIGRRIILYEMNQPPFSDSVSSFEIRQLNGAAFVGVSAGGHGLIDFQAVYGVSICGGVVEFLAVPHPTDATICTWAITNIDGCIWDYTTTQ